MRETPRDPVCPPQGAPGRSAGVCVLCERGRPFRRRLCRSCHRKLRACGLPLPPMAAPGPRPRPVAVILVAWLEQWSDEQRAALAVALAEVG